MGGSTEHREFRLPACERAAVASKLRDQRAEIEDTILARVFAVARLTGAEEPGYREGLRAAISAGVAYALEAIESGGRGSDPAPPAILVQARLAARGGVGLAVVLRRYAAGYSLLSDLLDEELRNLPSETSSFSALQGELTRAFERLITEVSDEYQREAERGSAVPRDRRQAVRVNALLAGERIGSAELGYELRCWHVGVIASGAGAPALVRRLARGPSLVVDVSDREAWGWLGAQERPDPTLLVARAEEERGTDSLLAIGEPGRDVMGWRATHRQALAALALARRDPRPTTRYGEVALLHTVLADEDLTRYLTENYLDPLTCRRGDDDVLRQTLRAYLSSGRNASSAAATLGVARQTVAARIAIIEERLACRIDSCAAELEVALRVAQFLGTERSPD